ncbi:MAG: hypothetical protein QOH16_3885 [Gaiellaceae bacterium]|nr:hypothetical protein [Gaiellaceae bacterium]
MPLRALINGRDLVAPLLDDAEWDSLRADIKAKRVALSLPCCEATAFARVSKLGTRHFFHRRANGCSGAGETFQHLWAKTEIVRACADAGWDAQTEVAGNGWRADVLATRGSARVAFEVQWSPQDQQTCRLRQERYSADGIRGCWLYRGDTPNPAVRELPIFRLVPDKETVALVDFAGQQHSVREFVTLLLGGKIRYSATVSANLRVSFVDYACWKCKLPAHIYYAQQLSRCGHSLGWDPADQWQDADVFDPAVLRLVKQWLAREGSGAGIRLGAIKKRYSKTVEQRYLSFGCPHCDAIFGNFFIRNDLLDAVLDDYHVARIETEGQATGGRQRHWCFPQDGHSYCNGEELAEVAA